MHLERVAFAALLFFVVGGLNQTGFSFVVLMNTKTRGVDPVSQMKIIGQASIYGLFCFTARRCRGEPLANEDADELETNDPDPLDVCPLMWILL